MRLFFTFIFLCSSLFANDWKDKIFDQAPQIVLDYARQAGIGREFQRSVDQSLVTAGPFSAPINNMRYVQNKGIRTPYEAKAFKKGFVNKTDFAVYKYTVKVPKKTKVYARGSLVDHLFKVYLNGELLGGLSNGMLYKKTILLDIITLFGDKRIKGTTVIKQ